MLEIMALILIVIILTQQQLKIAKSKEETLKSPTTLIYPLKIAML